MWDMAKKRASAAIEWRNIKVKLGQLQPWDHNPRTSTRKQAERILESFEAFGQVQTVAVSPTFEVYDGHQRLSALLTLHGKDYEIDARQASRALTDDERRRLVIALHAGAQGEWNWDMLSGWDESLLKSAGMDSDLLAQMNRDAAAIGELLNGMDTAAELWQGMPEFEQEDQLGFHQLTVHFENENGMNDFARRMGQTITTKTKSIWHPYKAHENLKVYKAEDES